MSLSFGLFGDHSGDASQSSTAPKQVLAGHEAPLQRHTMKEEQNPGSPRGPHFKRHLWKCTAGREARGEGSLQRKNNSCAHRGNIQCPCKLTDSRQESEREETAGQELKKRKKMEPWRRKERGVHQCKDVNGFQLCCNSGSNLIEFSRQTREYPWNIKYNQHNQREIWRNCYQFKFRLAPYLLVSIQQMLPPALPNNWDLLYIETDRTYSGHGVRGVPCHQSGSSHRNVMTTHWPQIKPSINIY